MEVSTINKIYYLDMFAGIGGFRSGLSNVGDFFVPVGYCEIDPYVRKAYEAIYDTKGELFFEDARKINPEELPHLDLICGGFPCQSFSVGRVNPASRRVREWGMRAQGRCVTAQISMSPSVERDCSLSGILETNAPEKYHLSPKQTQRLYVKSLKADKANGYTTIAD